MILYEGGEDIPTKINTSKVYCNGSTHETTNCGMVTVIAQEQRYYLTSKGHKTFPYFIVQFEDGTKIQTATQSIRTHKISNPNMISVYNVGYHGQGRGLCWVNGKFTKEYTVWKAMITRCYAKHSLKKNPTYKQCTVDKRWHCFQNFWGDIIYLKCYTEWKKDGNKRNKYELDKDIKIKGNKIYSKDTCTFVTNVENSQLGHKKPSLTGLTYIATRVLDQYQEEFTNQTTFASKFNLRTSGVCACLHGRQNSTRGWKIEIKENK